MSKDLTLENVRVVVIPLKMGKGFIPQYRMLLGFKQAFMDVTKATPDDLEKATQFLAEHIAEPAKPHEKRKLLEAIDLEQIMELFEAIVSRESAGPPPTSGENSAST